jgi:DNA-binding TFAR19-related protein (PDSD5 family)
LKNFYLSRLTNVRGTRDQIAANIESLQVQLTEAQMAVALVEAEINKVTVNENPVD